MRAWIASKPRLPAGSVAKGGYVSGAPGPQLALDLFEGEWNSQLPAPLDACRAGEVPLFEDERADWGIKTLGGVQGQRILELGPLEGGHTTMLERAGAAVTAVEANRHAYLRCLVVKELVGLQHARFLLGDFMPYLHETRQQFDICWASGVLYHQRNPVELIAQARHCSRRLFLWTHYYDSRLISRKPSLFMRYTDEGRHEYKGFRHRLHSFDYRDKSIVKGFCGGSDSAGYWLTREDLLACLDYFGWRALQIGHENLEHENGPSLALVAE